jgi:predicted RNA polymerase sigma factor
LKKSNSISKINNIYSKKNNNKDDKKNKKDKKDKKNKKDKKDKKDDVLTIIFAESCPYTLPEQFVINNDYKYFCSAL